MIKKLLHNIKKYCFCYFVHNKHLCYPEVWGRGLDGPWHCSECHPCGESLEKLLKKSRKNLTK